MCLRRWLRLIFSLVSLVWVLPRLDDEMPCLCFSLSRFPLFQGSIPDLPLDTLALYPSSFLHRLFMASEILLRRSASASEGASASPPPPPPPVVVVVVVEGDEAVVSSSNAVVAFAVVVVRFAAPQRTGLDLRHDEDGDSTTLLFFNKVHAFAAGLSLENHLLLLETGTVTETHELLHAVPPRFPTTKVRPAPDMALMASASACSTPQPSYSSAPHHSRRRRPHHDVITMPLPLLAPMLIPETPDHQHCEHCDPIDR